MTALNRSRRSTVSSRYSCCVLHAATFIGGTLDLGGRGGGRRAFVRGDLSGLRNESLFRYALPHGLVMAVLAVFVGKLFLIDLVALSALWRIALFLSAGGVFLLLSYALPGLGNSVEAGGSE